MSTRGGGWGGAQRDARQEGGSATSAISEGHKKACRGGLMPHPARGRMLKRCSRGTSVVGTLSQVASRGQVCQRLPAWRALEYSKYRNQRFRMRNGRCWNRKGRRSESHGFNVVL